MADTSAQYDDAFRGAAEAFKVDPDILKSMAHAESGFSPDVISGKRLSSTGAVGLMQFMPETAKRYGVDPLNPEQAIFGAAKYLRDNLDKFNGDYAKAVAAYNTGENRTYFDKPDWHKSLPGETLGYVDKVLKRAHDDSVNGVTLVKAPAEAPVPVVAPVKPTATPAKTPAEASKAPQEASWGNVVRSAPVKALAGVADTLYNAPENLVNLSKMVYGAGATALGRPDLAPNVTAPTNVAQNALTRMGAIAPTENMTTGQRIVDTGLQAATTGLINPASGVRNAMSNVVKGGIAGTIGQTATEATGSPLVGLAAGMVTPTLLEGRAASTAAAAQSAQARNAVRDQTLQAGQQQGLMVTPGSVKPTASRVAAEQIAGKSRVEQQISMKNQEVFDSLARRAVGLPENAALTVPAMKAVRAEEYAKGYVPLTQAGPIPTDQTFKQQLVDIAGKFTGPSKSFPGAMPDEVKKLVGSLRVGQFDAADGIQMSQTLRDAASGSFRQGNNGLGHAQIAASRAIEDQIERQLAAMNNPQAAQMLQQFRDSRVRMAVSHAVEDAIHVGSGSIDASKLASDLQKGKMLTNELETAARFANTFKNVSKSPANIGTPGAGSLFGTGLGSTVGAVTGAVLGGPIASVAGAATLPALSAGTRAYLQSARAQRNALAPYRVDPLLAQQPNNPALRNALIGLTVAD